MVADNGPLYAYVDTLNIILNISGFYCYLQQSVKLLNGSILVVTHMEKECSDVDPQ